MVYSTKPHKPTPELPTGVLVYMRTAEGNDSLAWIDSEGNSVTQSQLAILRAAECAADTPAVPRQEKHHELVEAGVDTWFRRRSPSVVSLADRLVHASESYERLKTYSDPHSGHALRDSRVDEGD